ncbi:MAG: thermostable hemolysin [Mariprofundaceae bacterium]|nr:thermostable hemolysin [Mariprofundaceae bacterium]
MLDVLHPGHHDREQAEAFIHDVFAREYGACVQSFMPHLIRLRYGQTGACYSVAGYKEATSGSLFVEQYLRESVDYALSHKIGQTVSRDLIVEVGNLAEAGPGGGRDIIIALVSFLFGAGYQWGVVTVVPKLANGFRRLGLRYVDLGVADPQKLSTDQRIAWGSYYDHKPMIRAADLRMTYRVLEVVSHKFPLGCREIMKKSRDLGLQWQRVLEQQKERKPA